LIPNAGYGLYSIGMDRGMKMGSSAAAGAGAQQAGAVDPATGKRIPYWHDPMVPGQKFDKPGKSPFMDMQLVPVYADEAGTEGTVRIDPRMQQNLGMRLSEVRKGALAPTVEAVGTVAIQRARCGARPGPRQWLRRKPPCARHSRPGAQGRAAGRAVRSRLGRGACGDGSAAIAESCP
jgi:hypothetical protein